MNRWRTIYDPEVDRLHVHVHPLDDHIEHDVATDECICGPTPEWQGADAAIEWMLIHHALDARETPPLPRMP